MAFVTPKKFEDSRGHFMETFNAEAFARAGLPSDFKQDNQSFSKKGVLRGLHIQVPRYQGKLVRVLSGRVFDVAVDLRHGSSTFGQWAGVELYDERMFYVPEGFAHGFLALEDSVFSYKCTDKYIPGDEVTLAYDDFRIPWLALASKFDITEFGLSQKDLSKAIGFNQFCFKYRSE